MLINAVKKQPQHQQLMVMMRINMIMGVLMMGLGADGGVIQLALKTNNLGEWKWY